MVATRQPEPRPPGRLIPSQAGPWVSVGAGAPAGRVPLGESLAA